MPEAARVTALIVDDEPVARAGLARMLGAIDWIECVGDAASGPAAVEAIDRLQPDVVLLDVEMPGYPGTEVLRRTRHQPQVVFTTAHSQHAVDAFELGALDYVMKPFGEERLRAALDRVRAALGEPRPASADRFAVAMGRGPMSRLFVRSGRSILPVDVVRVAWFEAQGDYVAAHVAAGPQHLLHVALNRLEERLDAKRFVRIHRTCIVNMDHVAAFRREPEGRLVAEMKDGARLDVSRARARELRALAR